MSLEELLLRGEIVREKTSRGEADRLLAAVHRRLEDAHHPGLHPETRLEQAYNAILGCAILGLRAHALRLSDRPGHHVVALESLLETLTVAQERVDYFQTLRDLRNRDVYTGGAHISDEQANEAVEEASRLVADVARWLEVRRAGG